MKRLVMFSLAIGGLLIGLAPVSVMAQTTLTISSPYPAVTVDPGGTATFALQIQTPTAERVDLTVGGTPTGWTARLRGGGSTISAVYTAANPTASGAAPAEPTATATLEVSLPSDVAPNTYHVMVSGKSVSGLTATLSLDMTVQQSGTGSVTATATQPQLKGKAGTTFNFDVAIKNDTNEQISFTLDTQGPTGWTVSATPSGSAQAATEIVPAGQTNHVSVSAEAPTDAQANAYPITFTATGGPQPLTVALGVTITGSYSLTFVTQDGRLNTQATVGSDSPLSLTVTNTGTAPIDSVTFTSSPPTGWTVSYAPSSLTQLAPNTPTNVTATIHPADTAVGGDYQLTLNANSTTQGTSANASLQIRTTVQASPIWGFVGVFLIALVVVILLGVFRFYGRR